MTAKHMCVCVSQNSRDSKSWKKKRLCPFPSTKPRPKKGKKAFSCEVAADFTLSNKGSFFNKTSGYKKSKNINANHIRVKSSQISPASLLTWTEFREKDVSFIV